MKKTNKTESKNVKIAVNRDCPVRMSMNCIPAIGNKIDPRLRKLHVPSVVSAKNFVPTNQAQLIDIVVRASQGMLTVREIAREVMKHSSFSVCFSYNIDSSEDMFTRVLGRVRRHNNNDLPGRVIKRNAIIG